jgi:hypothetical protein
MTRPSKSQVGLGAFVASVVTALGVLVYDLWLYLSGAETITEVSTDQPAWGVALVLLTLLGPTGLAAHFWYYRREE